MQNLNPPPLRDRQPWSTLPSHWQRAISPVSYVYVIRIGELYKIGVSVHPYARIKSMQLPETAEVCRIYLSRSAYVLERQLHGMFADCREHGEWFRLPEGALPRIDQFVKGQR